MHRKVLCVVLVSFASAIAACVSDEPATSSGSDADAATDSSAVGDAGGTDGAANAEAGTDSGSFTPASLPNLALWLDDESIDISGGTSVAKWEDKSGKTNHAVPAVDGGFPAMATVVAGGAGIGGKAAVHFNGATTLLQIPDSSSLRWASDFTLAVVERQSAGDASTWNAGELFCKIDPLSPNPGPNVNVQVSFPPYAAQISGSVDGNDFVVNSPDAATLAEVGHVVIFRWIADPTGTAGTLKLVFDDAVTTKRLVALPDIGAIGIDAFIGANGNGHNSYFAGDIATIIAVSGTTSDTDVANLLAYLKTRYGL